MEEIYYYRTELKNRFGLQCLYSPEHKMDFCFRVKNHDCLAIPFGFHPVSAPPDSRFYYLWMLSGNTRKLHYKTDPDFNEIK